MSIASNISLLVAAVATAFNTRGGMVGPSAYQMWLAAGNTGTVADFNQTLIGNDEDYAAYLNGLLGPAQTAGTASESQAGVTQLASLAEVQAGTTLTKAVSPGRLSAFLTAQQDFLATLTGTRRGTDSQRQNLSSNQLFEGLLFAATDTGITWRYTGVGWRPWDSWWRDANNSASGLAGGYNAANGWVSNGAQFRFRGGRVQYRGNLIMNGAGSVTGQIGIGLPTLNGSVIAAATPFGTPSVILLDAYRPNGQTFSLTGAPAGNFLYLGYIGANVQNLPTGPGAPFTWAQSDQVRWNFDYDPA